MQSNFKAYFNSNDGTGLLFFGLRSSLKIDRCGIALEELDQFIELNRHEYIALAISYDLKNEIEDLSSENEDRTNFPVLLACVPESVYKIENGTPTLIRGSEIESEKLSPFLSGEYALQQIPLKPRTSRSEYIEHVIKLKEHIQQGDIYEINYCQEFYADGVELKEPISIYHQVNEITNAPYSVYFNFEEHHVISGSPERFVRKTKNKLISQPIKGTRKRGASIEEDESLIEELRNDPKERSENVMIVDLVRNDLSRLAQKNSVKVDELFGIYSFETVHQMISTISCTLKPNLSVGDILRATFPMGSMTGAPKIRAMQLIEKYEDFRRGIFSGSIGYIKPNGDFDLNVIIRTMIYNQKEKYVSCPVGGAITIQSDPEGEYAECMTKIGRIIDAFQNE